MPRDDDPIEAARLDRLDREAAERRFARRSHPGQEPSDPPASPPPPCRVPTQPEWPPAYVQGRVGDGNPPSFPPPSPESIAKRMIPWIALSSAICGAAAWFFAAGRKTAEIPTRDELRAVASADVAQNAANASALSAVREQLASVIATQQAQNKSLEDIKTDVRELRATAGVRVTSPGHR